MRPDPLAVRLLVACALVVAAGCVGSSRGSRFYTLEPLAMPAAASPTATDAVLAVGPVELPDYLDRQAIVTRTGANELAIADFERWGGSLERDVGRSLVATVGARLAPRRVAVSGWRSVTLPPAASRYRASVSLSRFEGVLGRSVLLRGRWELVAEGPGESRVLDVGEAAIEEPLEGAGYDALVAGMQRALVRLGEEIAEAFVKRS